MKALRVNGNRLALEEIEIPHILEESLVRLLFSGICNTDLEIVKGYAGFTGTIGHEFVGIIESSPDRPDLVGKRVVGEINAGCGTCDLCLAGDPRHCPTRTVLGIKGRDGAHAEYLMLPSRNLIVVPEEISDRDAVFVEPFAAALGILEQVNFDGDPRVAVIGDGKLGLLCAIALSKRTGEVTLIGKHASKLNIAAERGIATKLLSEVSDSTSFFDIVIEASGSESGFETALNIVRPRGKIVLKSTFSGKPTWEAWRVVVDEITIVGSRCGRFEPALEMMASEHITFESLVTAEFPIDQALAAIDKAREKGSLKVLLSF